ncbi:hypothetical protein SCHPADRAFT_460094 [Schizopora paradoxa]|uniref:Uncharacterized protein n=1 Tax=Schizopora paradoxa TaxID=27342 RepID=A0A0H2RJ86_9AGAM|nr:hypothetical protein SCHPADRAFT_460094 [Schizopora paradoxa]
MPLPHPFLPSPSSILFEASAPGPSQPFEIYQQNALPSSPRQSGESLHNLLGLSSGGKAVRSARSKQTARSYGRRPFVANGRTPPISSYMEKPRASPPS